MYMLNCYTSKLKIHIEVLFLKSTKMIFYLFWSNIPVKLENNQSCIYKTSWDAKVLDGQNYHFDINIKQTIILLVS